MTQPSDKWVHQGDAPPVLYHASAVALNGCGVMLCGASGSGKSSLALKLMHMHKATLIADDRLWIARGDAGLILTPHEELVGLIELRGLGLLRMPFETQKPLALVVDLVARRDVPRLAEADYFTAFELRVPKLSLHAHDTTTPLAIVHALAALKDGFAADAIYPL